jgi:hypothetical protein
MLKFAPWRSSSLFKIDHPTRQGIIAHHIRVTKALALDGFSKLLRILHARRLREFLEKARQRDTAQDMYFWHLNCYTIA